MIRISRQLLLAAGLALPLGACHDQPAGPVAAASTAAMPDTKPGLAVSGGKLVLPAVKGNPAAAYFTLANNSDKPVSIADISVAGAGMAMLHETMAVDGHSTMRDMTAPTAGPSESLAFTPGGKHVMVFDVPAGLAPGGTVEMTLTFADGDKLSTPLAVEAPGGAN